MVKAEKFDVEVEEIEAVQGEKEEVLRKYHNSFLSKEYSILKQEEYEVFQG